VEAVRCVGRHVYGLACLCNEPLSSETELYLALEHGEHLFKVVTVRRWAAAGWNMHVDECVFAVGIVPTDKNRIGVPDEAEMRKAFVFVWPSDGEMALRIVWW
jgi:hypothetical protein